MGVGALRSRRRVDARGRGGREQRRRARDGRVLRQRKGGRGQ